MPLAQSSATPSPLVSKLICIRSLLFQLGAKPAADALGEAIEAVQVEVVEESASTDTPMRTHFEKWIKTPKREGMELTLNRDSMDDETYRHIFVKLLWDCWSTAWHFSTLPAINIEQLMFENWARGVNYCSSTINLARATDRYFDYESTTASITWECWNAAASASRKHFDAGHVVEEQMTANDDYKSVEKDRHMLAQAIMVAAIKAGLYRADIDGLTGPQLLMACDDLAEACLASGKAAAEYQHWIEFNNAGKGDYSAFLATLCQTTAPAADVTE